MRHYANEKDTKMKAQERINYMDIAKGIGILAIILGHTGRTFITLFFPFHVPLFFFVSGYFLNRIEKNSEFVKTKSRSLLLPYVVTSLILIIERSALSFLNGDYWVDELLNSFCSALYGSGSYENKTIFMIGPIGAIWFLLALLWALVIVKLLINVKYIVPIIIIVAFFSVISSKIIWLPWSIQSGMVACIYVYLGVWARNRCNFDSDILAVVGALVLLAEVLFDVNLSIVQNRFDGYGLSAIGAIPIIYTMIWLSKKIEKNSLCSRILCFLGKNTLPLMCFHLIELTIYPWGEYGLLTDIVLLVTFPILCVLFFKNLRIYKIVFCK